MKGWSHSHWLCLLKFKKTGFLAKIMTKIKMNYVLFSSSLYRNVVALNNKSVLSYILVFVGQQIQSGLASSFLFRISPEVVIWECNQMKI